jgi:tetratricopeptide (TPR) repeat protein
LDPNLGEAEVSLGLLAFSEWRWEEAERRYRRGLELSPGYAVGHHWFGTYLVRISRYDEAVETLRRALVLDPLSLPIQMGLSMAFFFGGRLEEAITVCRKAIEFDPAFPPAYNNLIKCLTQAARYEEALESMAALSRLDPEWLAPKVVEEVRAGYGTGGVRGFWEATLRSAAVRVQEGDSSAYFDMACACAQLERVDEAFHHLEHVLASRDPRASQALSEPRLAPLHSDPRFAELRRKFGLAGP